MTAASLVDNLWNIFDRETAILSGVLNDLADLFEEEKKVDLLNAWRDLRATVSHYFFSFKD